MRHSLRQLTFGAGKSGGRNSSGRITAFHRGGGSKRLQRRIDLKRSTSSMGIVERIEYDPNRSSRIALVRWIQGVHHHHHHHHHHRKCNAMKELLTPPRKVPESTTAATATATATISSLFSFSSLPGPLSWKSQASAGSKMTCAKDVFFSAFSSPKAKAMGETASSLSLPRIAVAGAKPAFFAPRMREEALGGKNTFSIGEVGKWRRDSILWAHRIKRKAAISWQGFRRQETL